MRKHLPSPPSENGFFQFLTNEAQEAIESRTGKLYHTLVEEIYRLNSQYFENVQEVETILQRYIWPPRDFRYFFADFPHIPEFPTHLKLRDSIVQVLISKPIDHLKAFNERSSLQIALYESFGGIEGAVKDMQEFVAKGGSPEEYNHYFLDQINSHLKRKKRLWWKFW